MYMYVKRRFSTIRFYVGSDASFFMLLMTAVVIYTLKREYLLLLIYQT